MTSRLNLVTNHCGPMSDAPEYQDSGILSTPKDSMCGPQFKPQPLGKSLAI